MKTILLNPVSIHETPRESVKKILQASPNPQTIGKKIILLADNENPLGSNILIKYIALAVVADRYIIFIESKNYGCPNGQLYVNLIRCPKSVSSFSSEITLKYFMTNKRIR